MDGTPIITSQGQGLLTLPVVIPAVKSELLPDGVVELPKDQFIFYSAHSGAINSLVASTDGNTLYSAGDDGRVVRSTYSRSSSNSKPEIQVRELFQTEKPILALALSPDEKFLAAAETGFVFIYDLKQEKVIYQLSRLKGRVSSLAWDPRGEFISIGLASGDLYAWSLESGWFTTPGQDSFDDLERYIGGVSPIVATRFHPSGAAFFAGEADGVLSVWRLLRTERELGLRDQFAEVDQNTDISERMQFANLTTSLEDLWMEPSAAVFYTALGDGSLVTWKVRGLTKLSEISLGNEELFSVSGISTPESAERALLVVSGREPRVRFVCSRFGPDEKGTLQSSLKMIAQTVRFPNPINHVATGTEGLVWGSEKADNIVVFDSKVLSRARKSFGIKEGC